MQRGDLGCHSCLSCNLHAQTRFPAPQPYCLPAQRGDLGCAAFYGSPRVQPLNDYRLIYFVKKCLDAYIVSCLGCGGGLLNSS